MEKGLKFLSDRHLRRKIKQSVTRSLNNVAKLRSELANRRSSQCTAVPIVTNCCENKVIYNDDRIGTTYNDSDDINHQNDFNDDNHENQSAPLADSNSFALRLDSEAIRYITEESCSDTDDSDAAPDYTLAEVIELKENLRQWACNNNITHTALSQLLKLLQPRVPGLPRDARSFLSTPRNIDITPMENGQLCYFGLQNELKSKLKRGIISPESNVIKLDFNIDGLPAFDSSTESLWPILCRSLSLKDQSPFVVALFSGTEKPKPLHVYFEQFITELEQLLESGIEYEQQIFKIEIRCFICDAPARSMVKMVSGHTSTFGCEKCCSKARVVNHKLHYPVDDSPRKRKDTDFTSADANTDKHIQGKSPLLRLCIGLVTQFPLDSMHLVFLGVIRRLLVLFWLQGKNERRKYKIPPRLVRVINDKIRCIIRPNMTYEFPRKPRPFKDIHHWKATEFRMFLLYYGPVVMRDALDQEKYQHFLMLHVAITILSNRKLLAVYFRIASDILKEFVSSSARIYGSDFVVYNVHSLQHLADDVKLYGPLGDFSSFPFENYLGILKRLLRSKRLPLQQVARRLVEFSAANATQHTAVHCEEKYKPHQVSAETDTSFQCQS